MFMQILYTLIRTLLVFSSLIVAFGFAFYLLMQNEVGYVFGVFKHMFDVLSYHNFAAPNLPFFGHFSAVRSIFQNLFFFNFFQMFFKVIFSILYVLHIVSESID